LGRNILTINRAFVVNSETDETARTMQATSGAGSEGKLLIRNSVQRDATRAS